MLLDVTYSHVVTIIISFINVIGLLFYYGSTENVFKKTLKNAKYRSQNAQFRNFHTSCFSERNSGSYSRSHSEMTFDK